MMLAVLRGLRSGEMIVIMMIMMNKTRCWPRLRGLRSGDYDCHYGGYRNQDDQDAQLAEIKRLCEEDDCWTMLAV